MSENLDNKSNPQRNTSVGMLESGGLNGFRWLKKTTSLFVKLIPETRIHSNNRQLGFQISINGTITYTQPLTEAREKKVLTFSDNLYSHNLITWQL